MKTFELLTSQTQIFQARRTDAGVVHAIWPDCTAQVLEVREVGSGRKGWHRSTPRTRYADRTSGSAH